MKYEERKKLLSGWLFNFLKRYDVPSHFDDDATREEMILIVEDMNSEIPNCEESSFKLLLDKVASRIRKTSKTRKWPTTFQFTNAIKDYREEVIKDNIIDVASNLPKDFDQSEFWARKIKKGEDVPHHWIEGISAHRLLERSLVTEEDLQPYKKYLAHKRKNITIGDR